MKIFQKLKILFLMGSFFFGLVVVEYYSQNSYYFNNRDSYLDSVVRELNLSIRGVSLTLSENNGYEDEDEYYCRGKRDIQNIQSEDFCMYVSRKSSDNHIEKIPLEKGDIRFIPGILCKR